MKIVDPINRPINANCTFEFRGFTISISTIFRNCNIGIFRADDPTFERYALTVEEALEYVITRTSSN